MRFNPRTVYYQGKYNKRTERHDGVGGLVGLTVRQWIGVLDLVIDYRANDTTLSDTPDGESYNREQLAIVKKIQGWIEAGPKPFDKTKQGLYRSRGDETVLLLDSYAEINQLFTQVSLRLSDMIDRRAEGYDILNEVASDRAVLSETHFETKYLQKAVEKLVEMQREKNWNEEDKPIIKRSAFSIKRRREEVLSAKKFRLSMKEMFAKMDAKRNGTVYEAPPEPAPYVAPAKPVYVKPEQRPTGPTNDLPTPMVKIGDKLRPSIGKGVELEYYKKQLVRKMLKSIRGHYREWAKTDAKYRKPMKIHDGNKANIRETIRVIETAYEVEVAGVIARPSQPYVANQCYVGGGSGWSGLSYGCALLFRAEQENKDQPERGPNQVAYLLHEFCLPDYHTVRYLMENPEPVE